METITSKNVEEIFENNPEQFKDFQIIDCEEGEEFQEYVYTDTNEIVPAGTPIGYERIDGEGNLTLLDDISFLSNA